MSDLIERLRNASGRIGETSTQAEAADAIESQAKRIAEQDALLKTYAADVDGWKRAHQSLESINSAERAQHELALCNLREAQSKWFNAEKRLSDATEAQQVLGLKLAQVEAERDALKVEAERKFCKAVVATQFADEYRRGRLICDVEKLLHYINKEQQ